jgi:hypothetical protein
VILQRAKEKYPEAKPRIISDNGPQFIARDFKGFHLHLGHDACKNFSLIPSIERENRALAQIAQKRMTFDPEHRSR